MPLPPVFNEAAEARKRINFAEMAYHFYPYLRDGAELLSPVAQEAMEAGNKVLARDYQSARDLPKVLTAALEELLTRCDVLLCPAATGPAPRGLETTGDPIFNGLWTLCGSPCVTLPLMTSEEGLPMGVQLVGGHGQDGRLMRSAQWLFDWADGATE